MANPHTHNARLARPVHATESSRRTCRGTSGLYGTASHFLLYFILWMYNVYVRSRVFCVCVCARAMCCAIVCWSFWAPRRIVYSSFSHSARRSTIKHLRAIFLYYNVCTTVNIELCGRENFCCLVWQPRCMWWGRAEWAWTLEWRKNRLSGFSKCICDCQVMRIRCGRSTLDNILWVFSTCLLFRYRMAQKYGQCCQCRTSTNATAKLPQFLGSYATLRVCSNNGLANGGKN